MQNYAYEHEVKDKGRKVEVKKWVVFVTYYIYI